MNTWVMEIGRETTTLKQWKMTNTFEGDTTCFIFWNVYL